MLNKKRLDSFRLLKYTFEDKTIVARLPDVYKKFREDLQKTPKPVHYEAKSGRWEKDPTTGLITPVQNIPIPTRFPQQLNQVFLGGDMVIRGFTKKGTNRRVPRFWVPVLKRSVVYSEILNKHFNVIVTERFILQIHAHKGLDNYLLENPPCELRSAIALKMKKRILSALLHKELPYDQKRNDELYEKYKQYIIPKEELEWFGLSLPEACKKQMDIEEEEERRQKVPFKIRFRQELLEELKLPTEDPIEEKQSGWLSRIARPFSKSD